MVDNQQAINLPMATAEHEFDAKAPHQTFRNQISVSTTASGDKFDVQIKMSPTAEWEDVTQLITDVNKTVVFQAFFYQVRVVVDTATANFDLFFFGDD